MVYRTFKTLDNQTHGQGRKLKNIRGVSSILEPLVGQYIIVLYSRVRGILPQENFKMLSYAN